MKSVMKIMVMFVALLMSVSVFGQSPEKIGKVVAKEVETRATIMKLDTTQQSKVKIVLTTYYKERNAAKQLKGKEKGVKMKEARKKMDDAISQVCTPQQLDAWKKHVAATAAAKKEKEK